MNLEPDNISIIGSSGSIGSAFAKLLSERYKNAAISAFSQQEPERIMPNISYHAIDYENESSIEDAANIAARNNPLDLVIVATGILHDDEIMPEKSLKDLEVKKFNRLFQANTIFPALIAKHFLPKLNPDKTSFFVALSARVGSISDNQLGGWYSYRASKAALNMIIKNAAIEIERRNKKAIVAGLHPGTVDSHLSKPFQRNVPNGKLFTPDYSVEKLLDVIKGLTPNDRGKCFAWDGKEVLP